MVNVSDNVKVVVDYFIDMNEVDGVYKFLKEFIL